MNLLKDWIDYLQTLVNGQSDTEQYDNDEWSDQYYGLSEYREYTEIWC